MATDALGAALAVTRILDELGLDYLIGGSLASSLHGIPRSTQDADILVDLPGARVDELVSRLGPTFYVSADRAREAIASRGSFNVIHLGSMYKVDLFVLGDDTLSQLEMRRRERHRVGPGEGVEVFVASAEDIVLQKLRWYEAGGRVSDRQWRDLVGVLEVSGESLDLDYLRAWAARCELRELLEEALAEAARLDHRR